MKKEEILQLMRIYQKEYDQYTDCIMYEDFDSIAESIVKLCNLQNVSNRRELLFAFGKYLEEHNVTDFTPQMHIDDFLSKQ